MTRSRMFPQIVIAASLLFALPAAAAQRGDTDGDGKLALSEFQALMTKRMMRADSNSDGRISLDEWKARPAAAKAKRDPAKVFGRMDKNGDGFLDTAEIDPLLKKRFDRLDANSDGSLSDSELAARKTAAAN